MSELFGGSVEAVGAAMHNYGEYYYMFGWIGIIVEVFLFGFILKKKFGYGS